jgi:hypothetical protein
MERALLKSASSVIKKTPRLFGNISFINDDWVSFPSDRWFADRADSVILDPDVDHEERIELYQEIPLSAFRVPGSHHREI